MPLGMVREAVARALNPRCALPKSAVVRRRLSACESLCASHCTQHSPCRSSAALVPARHSIEANACVADITALGDFLRLYSHVHRLTIRSPVNYPFTLPHLPNLHSLALVLSDIPLPFDKPLPVRGMCLELTRWRQPVSDIARLSMHTQLRTLKLFVNRIGGVSPAILDLSPLRALSDLHELHVVSYQLNRPLLTLPFLGALTQLELHSVIVTPSELYAYSSLTSLRLSLLTMPGDADEVIATVFRKNTGLRSLAISWGGDVDDELPCHCMRSAPPTVERLALAPLVDFRAISHLTKLSYLDLRSCHSAFSVARFPDLTSLRTLVIDDRPPFRDRHLNVLASVQRVLIVAEGDDNGLAARVRTAAPQIQVLVNPPERLIAL